MFILFQEILGLVEREKQVFLLEAVNTGLIIQFFFPGVRILHWVICCKVGKIDTSVHHACDSLSTSSIGLVNNAKLEFCYFVIASRPGVFTLTHYKNITH